MRRGGTLEFSEDGVRAAYLTQFLEVGISVSSCVPMYINKMVDVEQAYMERGEGGSVTVDQPLTDEAVINNASIANWIITFSERRGELEFMRRTA